MSGKNNVELRGLMVGTSTLTIFDDSYAAPYGEGAQDAQGAQLDEQVKNIAKQLRKVEGAQGAHQF